MDERSPFATLQPQPPDELLSLIGLYRDDDRVDKIDLGVGVYRDDFGETPVFQAIKAAEEILLSTQKTKSYLGPEGNVDFTQLLRPIIFGELDQRLSTFGVQTPGGTGALRLAAELVNAANPGTNVWLGMPSWANHAHIFSSAGLNICLIPYFDIASQTISFDAMMMALAAARPGDLLLLQGSCHNPTGADLSLDQWRKIANYTRHSGVIPLIDLAYQGLGHGLEDDSLGYQLVLSAAPESLLAYSCNKNFGLYRERVGALYALNTSTRRSQNVRSNILALARANWSMPPDHGAAAVVEILRSKVLSAQWQAELRSMRQRIITVRTILSEADPVFENIRNQNGIFSTLHLTLGQVRRLREEFAIYMTESARINVAGLSSKTIPIFVRAFRTVFKDHD